MKERYKKALMDMACRFGQTSAATRLKVGCLIYKNDSIISLGVNGQPPGWHTERCEGVDGHTLPTVRHAEAAALEKLYNSTETSEGATVFVSHSPCIYCAIKLHAAKISKVIYRYQYRNTEGLDFLSGKGVEIEQCGE